MADNFTGEGLPLTFYPLVPYSICNISYLSWIIMILKPAYDFLLRLRGSNNFFSQKTRKCYPVGIVRKIFMKQNKYKNIQIIFHFISIEIRAVMEIIMILQFFHYDRGFDIVIYWEPKAPRMSKRVYSGYIS